MPILSTVGEAVHALGYYFLDAIPEGPRDAEGKPRIVAIFAGMDDLAYCTTILALSRAGFRVRLKFIGVATCVMILILFYLHSPFRCPLETHCLYLFISCRQHPVTI